MSPQELIDSVDQLKIWEVLVGEGRLNHRFLRPSFLGGDKKPDCRLALKNGKIKFFDPPKQLSWDILDCVDYLYPQDNWQDKVDRILTWNGSARSTADKLAKGEIWVPNFTLTPQVVEWSDFGKEYWAARGVDYKILSHPKILTKEICGHEISGINEQGSYYTSQEGQGFAYFCNDRVKCYYPLAPRERKWKGRFKPEDCWLVNRNKYRVAENKPDTKTLIISKSNKDLLCWLQFVSCDLLCLSAEGVHPSPEWLFTNVRMKYERCLIVLDPDEAGILGANKLLNTLTNLSNVNTFTVKSWPFPDPVTKDLDYYRVTHGHDATLKFLKANNFHKIFDQ